MNSQPQLRPIIRILRQPALGWPTVLLGGAALLASPALLAAGPPVSFSAATNYITGPGSIWTSVGDFNGDGKVDLVTASYDSDTVSVLLGNGDGTFGSPQNFSAGNGPSAVAVGDLDGDGDADLVTTNFLSANASVLLGNGDGSFAAPVSYATGSEPYSARLAQLTDLDLDGNLDLVTANAGSNSVSVLRGNGDGTFGAQTAFAVGAGPTMVTVGDVNNDGHLDLVTGNSNDSNATLLLGDGHGGFAPGVVLATGGSGVWSVTLGDLDQDGDLDLVAGNRYSNTAAVLLGNGDGSFAAPVTYATGAQPISVTLGDLNNDGKLDLLISNFSGNTVSVLLGNGDGSFAAKTDVSGFNTPVNQAMADLNADGKLDLVIPNFGGNTTSVLLNTTVMLSLSFAGDTLTIIPPPVETCATPPSEYVIHYNTQARLAATPPLGWGIWARGWPTGVTTLPLGTTKTAAGCKTLSGALATCFRPLAIGEQDPGETYVYRIYAKCGGAWTLPSPQLTVTRPLP